MTSQNQLVKWQPVLAPQQRYYPLEPLRRPQLEEQAQGAIALGAGLMAFGLVVLAVLKVFSTADPERPRS